MACCCEIDFPPIHSERDSEYGRSGTALLRIRIWPSPDSIDLSGSATLYFRYFALLSIRQKAQLIEIKNKILLFFKATWAFVN